MKRMQTLGLLFPGNLVANLVNLSFFVRPMLPLCYRAIEISVHNIEIAPTSNSRFNDNFKFGIFYRLEFCTEFFSYSSQTSSWCPIVADPTVGKYTVGCVTILTGSVSVCL